MGQHTLTPEQAKGIDWGTLIARLLELRSPLRLLVERIAASGVPLGDEVLNALGDVLSTVDAIDELVKQRVEDRDDATTT